MGDGEYSSRPACLPKSEAQTRTGSRCQELQVGVSPPNSGSQSGRRSTETLALKPKAKSLVPGGKEYSRKRSSLWEAANPGWSFLNILSSGKEIRGLWIVVAITMKSGREMREGGGERRKSEGSEGEGADLSPSRHFVLREWGWENFSLHQLSRLPSDKSVLFL